MLVQGHNEFGAITRTVTKDASGTVFRGRWFKAFAEPGPRDDRKPARFWPDGPAIWYLSDHDGAVAWGINAPLAVIELPGVTASEQGRVLPNDVGCARTLFDAADAAEHALNHLERRATLAWIAGRIPSPWPKSTAPGKYANDLQPGFTRAFGQVSQMYLDARAAEHRGAACETCGQRPASRCAYCRTAVCERHGSEHGRACGLSTVKVFEHGRKVAVHHGVRIEPARRRLCDCPRMPGWGTACVHVRARLAEVAGVDDGEDGTP